MINYLAMSPWRCRILNFYTEVRYGAITALNFLCIYPLYSCTDIVDVNILTSYMRRAGKNSQLKLMHAVYLLFDCVFLCNFNQ